MHMVPGRMKSYLIVASAPDMAWAGQVCSKRGSRACRFLFVRESSGMFTNNIYMLCKFDPPGRIFWADFATLQLRRS